MSRPKILLTRRFPEPVEQRLRQSYDMDVNPHDRPMDRADLAAALSQYDAVCPNPTDKMDASMFEGGNFRTRILANYAVGYEHIDIEAARRAGLRVSNTPEATTEPTADLALTLILMTTRRAGEGERELRAGGWTGWRPGHLVGQSVSGKLLGLVGFGRIGQATAHRARAFGMRIAYYSRRRADPEIEAQLGATHYSDLDTLVREADVLSLHCPGGAETRHLVNAERLALMKPTAILINTSRGSVVDEAALAEALATRRIYAAGLDVFEREPSVPDSLKVLENAVLLPHLGSATAEGRIHMGMQVADNLDAFFAGKPLPNPVV